MTAPAVLGKDLEAIVTLLELAAIYLTNAPGDEFSFEQLIAQAREIGGDEIVLDEADVKIVLSVSSFLRKAGGKYQLK